MTLAARVRIAVALALVLAGCSASLIGLVTLPVR
jgi:hypothetical protein